VERREERNVSARAASISSTGDTWRSTGPAAEMWSRTFIKALAEKFADGNRET
jgi:hypothetical protein